MKMKRYCIPALTWARTATKYKRCNIWQPETENKKATLDSLSYQTLDLISQWKEIKD